MREALGDDMLIFAGKMHAAGSRAEAGEKIVSKEDIRAFAEAGADVILLPAPGTVPGVSFEFVHGMVSYIHELGKLSLTAIGTSQEGASPAGTDFISLMVPNKTGQSIWGLIFAANCVVLVVFGAMFGWEAAAYSIIFQFISTKAIEMFYHRYDRVTLQIVTKRPEQILDAYNEVHKHGSSVMEVMGGRSRQRYWLINTVVSSYEIDDVMQLIREKDGGAVVNVFRTENFFGNFYRAPID